jgi:iron complex outermembrane receptor protein
MRHGARLGSRGHYRVYSKYADHAQTFLPDGSGAEDGWSMLHTGFRTDWNPSSRDALTVEGGLFRGRGHEWGEVPQLTRPFSVRTKLDVEPSGGHVLTDWTRRNPGGSETDLRFYFDRSARNEGVLRDRCSTFDVDLQHRLSGLGRHEVLLGAGERVIRDSLTENFLASFNPSELTYSLSNAFAQDEIMLAEDRLYVTVGAKLERNSFTGLELQPTARLLWTPAPSHSLWMAASRAVRTPSRRDRDMRMNAGILGVQSVPVLISVFGSQSFRSEVLHAYELGYRGEPARRVSLDLAAFYNRYNKLSSYEPGDVRYEPDPQPAHILVPLTMGNQMDGNTYGAEAAATVHATSRWKWSAGYAFLKMRLRPYAASRDPYSFLDQDASPRHQTQLRSYLDISPKLGLDAALFRVGAFTIPGRLGTHHPIPAYSRVDVRLGWRATRELEFSAGAQNLFDSRHPEFEPEALTDGSAMGRSAYMKLTWLF